MEFNFQITPGAKALYQNGVDFLRAAERCLGMDDNGKVTIVDNGVFRTLAAPAVVNAAFACEMFLKSLINKSGKAYPTGRKGHDLLGLNLALLILNCTFQNGHFCSSICILFLLCGHGRPS